jgi:glycosyltransferase involved in cell wall biosynthesis
MSVLRPFVSVLTPTYNRRKFIPALIKIYKSQTYPKDRMEWIILDDGTDKVEDLFVEAAKTIPNVHYIRNEEKLLIGQKRNRMNDAAKGNIIIAMDDDDYYPPERVAHVVQKFAQNPKIELAGSSEMLLYFTIDKKIIRVGSYGPTHATNGTIAYRKSYLSTHRYDEIQTHAEEKSFLEEYKNQMIQLDPMKTILVMCHSDNTFDKYNLREKKNPLLKETTFKLRDIVSDKSLREFYASC